MPKVTAQEVQRALAKVARDKDAPKVIFPHGFRIVDFEGEKVLRPLTPDEYKEVVSRETGKAPSAQEMLDPPCTMTNVRCVSTGCEAQRGRCEMHFNPRGGYVCLCIR
jgi:hypothetical protein